MVHLVRGFDSGNVWRSFNVVFAPRPLDRPPALRRIGEEEPLQQAANFPYG